MPLQDQITVALKWRFVCGILPGFVFPTTDIGFADNLLNTFDHGREHLFFVYGVWNWDHVLMLIWSPVAYWPLGLHNPVKWKTLNF